MGDRLIDVLPWIRALHVIAVIAWMAGMLYLPRLYVYHSPTCAKTVRAMRPITLRPADRV